MGIRQQNKWYYFYKAEKQAKMQSSLWAHQIKQLGKWVLEKIQDFIGIQTRKLGTENVN